MTEVQRIMGLVDDLRVELEGDGEITDHVENLGLSVEEGVKWLNEIWNWLKGLDNKGLTEIPR